MSALSFVHLGLGVVALVLGIVMLTMAKGTRRHRVLGWIYVVLMAISVAAILVKTRAHLAPFAGYAVFVLVALVAAIASSRLRTTMSAWRGWHAGLMLLTFLGASMAAASIVGGAMLGAGSGPPFYRAFNAIIVAFTAIALWLIWRSRTVWGANPGEAVRRARRDYTLVVTVSSLALVVAQWPLAFP